MKNHKVMNYTQEDLEILKKETNLSDLEAEKLLKDCQGDVVDAILKHQGDPIINNKDLSSNSNEKPLTIHQQKIQELRNIVDQKDEMMEGIIQRQKEEKAEKG